MVTNELIEVVGACRRAPELPELTRFVEEIVVRVGPDLHRFVSGLCSEEAVDDVLQETLVAIGTHILKFRGSSDRQFWGWCYRIARNKVADHQRRTGRAEVVSLDIEAVRQAVEASAVDHPTGGAERLELEAAMTKLGQAKPPCVQYLTLHFLEGLDYGEMASVLRRSADAVRMQIKRCLALARQLLTEKE